MVNKYVRKVEEANVALATLFGGNDAPQWAGTPPPSLDEVRAIGVPIRLTMSHLRTDLKPRSTPADVVVFHVSRVATSGLTFAVSRYADSLQSERCAVFLTRFAGVEELSSGGLFSTSRGEPAYSDIYAGVALVASAEGSTTVCDFHAIRIGQVAWIQDYYNPFIHLPPGHTLTSTYLRHLKELKYSESQIKFGIESVLDPRRPRGGFSEQNFKSYQIPGSTCEREQALLAEALAL